MQSCTILDQIDHYTDAHAIASLRLPNLAKSILPRGKHALQLADALIMKLPGLQPGIVIES